MFAFSIFATLVNKPAMSKFYYLFFVLCSFVGCLYQVSDILNLYFQYKTISNLVVSVPMKLITPDITLCVKYADIIDVKQLEKVKKVKLKSRTPLERFLELQEIVTVKDIFELTPNISGNIDSCTFRIPNGYAEV